MKKEDLLDKLRKNTREQFDMPDLSINAIKYPDTVKQFIEMSKAVGGKVKCIKKTDDTYLRYISKVFITYLVCCFIT